MHHIYYYYYTHLMYNHCYKLVNSLLNNFISNLFMINNL